MVTLIFFVLMAVMFQSIFTFAPNSSGALEYYRLSEEVIGRV